MGCRRSCTCSRVAAAVNADVGFDTTLVSDGAHHLVVSVVDAAGNATTVLDRNVAIANPPPAAGPGPPNGTNASAAATLTVGWKGVKGARLSTGYGRAETIVGRLTAPGGVPIVGAQIDAISTPRLHGRAVGRDGGPADVVERQFLGSRSRGCVLTNAPLLLSQSYRRSARRRRRARSR